MSPRKWSDIEIAYLIHYLYHGLSINAIQICFAERLLNSGPTHTLLAIGQKVRSIREEDNLKNKGDLKDFLEKHLQEHGISSPAPSASLQEWELEIIQVCHHIVTGKSRGYRKEARDIAHEREAGKSSGGTAVDWKARQTTEGRCHGVDFRV
ncbi:hypothetical protein EX30DRAFT_341542 [Ascodesmis nigricans]|uniref:Uncharacterized protein n=1 Tax=Ascodesmis nigricans TaxID=341454 RepID=A0A4S2MUR4_9PEZI|nr:hypothetical protein EX30DRAFT_341542 [Ascodesmis nigricans]